MTACAVCDRPVAGADPALGAWHAECVARRLPHDAVVALLAALVVVLAPPIVLWAA